MKNEKLEALKERQAHIEARIKAEEHRQKVKDRKKDTRIKIQLGGEVMKYLKEVYGNEYTFDEEKLGAIYSFLKFQDANGEYFKNSFEAFNNGSDKGPREQSLAP